MIGCLEGTATRRCADLRGRTSLASQTIESSRSWVIFTGVLPWGSSGARERADPTWERVSERQATVRRMQSLRVRY
jgi:hypothetical protein